MHGVMRVADGARARFAQPDDVLDAAAGETVAVIGHAGEGVEADGLGATLTWRTASSSESTRTTLVVLLIGWKSTGLSERTTRPFVAPNPRCISWLLLVEQVGEYRSQPGFFGDYTDPVERCGALVVLLVWIGSGIEERLDGLYAVALYGHVQGCGAVVVAVVGVLTVGEQEPDPFEGDVVFRVDRGIVQRDTAAAVAGGGLGFGLLPEGHCCYLGISSLWLV
jgi:hypothetical protein